MYKKILIPTDGSDISVSAAEAGVAFAKQIGAEVVGIFISPEYQYPIYVEFVPDNFPTEDDYKRTMLKTGEIYLNSIQQLAEKNGVKFSGETLFSDAIAKEIVHSAEKSHCELIFIGSHGRSGWGQVLLGSVTAKVLSMCQIPVLVHRLKKEPSASVAK